MKCDLMDPVQSNQMALTLYMTLGGIFLCFSLQDPCLRVPIILEANSQSCARPCPFRLPDHGRLNIQQMAKNLKFHHSREWSCPARFRTCLKRWPPQHCSVIPLIGYQEDKLECPIYRMMLLDVGCQHLISKMFPSGIAPHLSLIVMKIPRGRRKSSPYRLQASPTVGPLMMGIRSSMQSSRTL
jgi:hypothetical protein